MTAGSKMIAAIPAVQIYCELECTRFI